MPGSAEPSLAGVFHHISPGGLADLYFHEIGFRWSQRVVSAMPCGKAEAARKVRRSCGHGFRRHCNYRRCSVLPPAGKCAEATMEALSRAACLGEQNLFHPHIVLDVARDNRKNLHDARPRKTRTADPE